MRIQLDKIECVCDDCINLRNLTYENNKQIINRLLDHYYPIFKNPKTEGRTTLITASTYNSILLLVNEYNKHVHCCYCEKCAGTMIQKIHASYSAHLNPSHAKIDSSKVYIQPTSIELHSSQNHQAITTACGLTGQAQTDTPTPDNFYQNIYDEINHPSSTEKKKKKKSWWRHFFCGTLTPEEVDDIMD